MGFLQRKKPFKNNPVGFNPLEKYARQIGFISPIFGMKIKNMWNHHLE